MCQSPPPCWAGCTLYQLYHRHVSSIGTTLVSASVLLSRPVSWPHMTIKIVSSTAAHLYLLYAGLTLVSEL